MVPWFIPALVWEMRGVRTIASVGAVVEGIYMSSLAVSGLVGVDMHCGKEFADVLQRLESLERALVH